MSSPSKVLNIACHFAEWIDEHKMFGWGLIAAFVLLAGSIGYAQYTFEETNTKKIESYSATLTNMSGNILDLKNYNEGYNEALVKFENRVDGLEGKLNVMEGKLDLLIQMNTRRR